MNCSFVAFEAGEHPLQLIGDCMGLSREGVRLIQNRALRKLREASKQAEHGSLHESVCASGEDDFDSPYEVTEFPNKADIVSTFDGGDLDY